MTGLGHNRKPEHYGRTVTTVRSGSGPDQNLKKNPEPPGTSRPELPVGSVRDRPCTDALPARPAGLAFLREQMALIEPFAPLGSPYLVWPVQTAPLTSVQGLSQTLPTGSSGRKFWYGTVRFLPYLGRGYGTVRPDPILGGPVVPYFFLTGKVISDKK